MRFLGMFTKDSTVLTVASGSAATAPTNLHMVKGGEGIAPTLYYSKTTLNIDKVVFFIQRLSTEPA